MSRLVRHVDQITRRNNADFVTTCKASGEARMPHAAIVVTVSDYYSVYPCIPCTDAIEQGAFIVGVAVNESTIRAYLAIITEFSIAYSQAYTVYKELIQPTLEQRRRDEEEEWNAQELDRVMQLSIIEHQHEEQRRADQERWEQRQQAAHSTSSNARYDIDTPATMRRRRQADVSTELPDTFPCGHFH